MEIKAIRTEADYVAALEQVSALIDLDPASDLKVAADETGLPVSEFPSSNPFRQAEILDEEFFPDVSIEPKMKGL
jgi:hypothetical protein